MRLFLACDLEARVKDSIQVFIEKFRKWDGAVRWVRPENIHITLYFFGEVKENDSISLQQLITKALMAVHPFPVTIEGISGFPSLARPRVLWVGVKNPTNELREMYTLVDRHLQESGIGIQSDAKGYTPHVTVARIKGPLEKKLVEQLENCREQEFGSYQINNAVLYQSILKRDGPQYVPVKVIEL
jgi:2'-5' RNA ligase